MAANDYYHGGQQNYYSQQSSNSLPYGSSYAQTSYTKPSYAPSAAPSYHSSDPLETSSRPSVPPKNPSNSAPYTDEIPMQSTTKLQTQLNDHHRQKTSYPPSPESQQPSSTPAYFVSSMGRKKRGFFTGKVPWFVYIITLIQCTVFVVEIIKNCKKQSCRRKHLQNVD